MHLERNWKSFFSIYLVFGLGRGFLNHLIQNCCMWFPFLHLQQQCIAVYFFWKKVHWTTPLTLQRVSNEIVKWNKTTHILLMTYFESNPQINRETAWGINFSITLVWAVEYWLQKTRFTKFAKVFWTSVLPVLVVSLFQICRKRVINLLYTSNTCISACTVLVVFLLML